MEKIMQFDRSKCYKADGQTQTGFVMYHFKQFSIFILRMDNVPFHYVCFIVDTLDWLVHFNKGEKISCDWISF